MEDLEHFRAAFDLLPIWGQTLVWLFAGSIFIMLIELWRPHRHFDQLSEKERQKI